MLICQGKEEFEKNQRQLLEKGNIIRNNKTQLEQQQVRVCRTPQCEDTGGAEDQNTELRWTICFSSQAASCLLRYTSTFTVPYWFLHFFDKVKPNNSKQINCFSGS